MGVGKRGMCAEERREGKRLEALSKSQWSSCTLSFEEA